MARIRVLTSEGDTAVVWDPEKSKAGDPEAVAALREAERIFRESQATGATTFRVLAGTTERMGTFDPTAEEILVVPRLVGG